MLSITSPATPSRAFAFAQALGMAALLAASSGVASAQADQPATLCTQADTIAIRGNTRVGDATIRNEIAFKPGDLATPAVLTKTIKDVYALGQFDGDIALGCDVTSFPGKAMLVLTVKERAILGDIKVVGVKALSARAVRDRVDLLIGRPVDPAQVARARSRIDSLYESSGYYLARVVADSSVMPDGRVALTVRIEEGHRLAISGVNVIGNAKVKDGAVAAAMKIKPEGFWWFRRGEFDEDKYVGDLGERIPSLYSRLGYIDMRIVQDTLLVDRDRGKGLVQLTIDEGPRYRVGSFEISGNRRFPTDQLKTYYPFAGEGPTLTARLKSSIKREANAPEGVFNQAKWDEALGKVEVAYHNEGYLYAQVTPVVERQTTGPDSGQVVNLRWEVEERNPAIINRIEILGNDYTSEECIRRQIFLPPGSPFNQDLLVRAWQGIRNMGFFEQDMAFPETKRINEQGDIDVTFRVKEKRTGSINFGASMGQGGVGFGGFVGVEQPNLWGNCKKGSLNWQYGRYFNDFSATYQDPTLRGSRISGTLNAYRSQSRFTVGNLGQNVRTGAALRFGFPVPWSNQSVLSMTYQGEAATFLSGTIAGQCTKNCFRSSIGTEYTHDTRVELPFPTNGTMRTLTLDLTGGPLGGTVNFQRVTGEARAYATLAQLGSNLATAPKIVVGLKANGGALFGNSGPFFFQQQFSVGGVMYGQALRGYPEFSITPKGFLESTSQYQSDPASFGNAFMTMTGEIGLRINSSLYINAFSDVGNNWASAKQINPTRLFRSAGFGASTVTPLGPLGLDIAYGFDRTKINPLTLRVQPDPRWQFHFRLGQIF